ncbi:FAD-binding oxidoreductase [Omnitrophica bacterium]|nr:FAD-binding oxidoreductase [Candidatus Omnitrophota bacterium]
MLPFRKSVLPYGLGRSYGDCCLNSKGILLDTTGLDRFIELDIEKKTLRCEAGVSLEAVLQLIVPKGLFLPVVPGTKYVTVGGAIANDVHGKNHHCAGTFGRYVKKFELLRSDGQRMICSETENSGMYKATIGGIGLTGLIVWAEIEVKSIPSEWINVECIRFENLDAFYELSEASNRDFEYTVAWVDGLSKARSLGRGIFMRGNHACESGTIKQAPSSKKLSIPFYAPGFLLNPLTIQAFNHYFYHKQKSKRESKIMHFDPFFFPLDTINDWNRLYGKKGFYQYQFVLPASAGKKPLKEIMSIIAASGQASFLAILKTFGEIQSPGILSFPQKGVTVALDFPNRKKKIPGLLGRLDRLVMSHNGRVYLAKDAMLKPEAFKKCYPQYRNLLQWKDARSTSDLMKRLTKEDQTAIKPLA